MNRIQLLILMVALQMAGCQTNQSQPPLFGGGPPQAPLFGSNNGNPFTSNTAQTQAFQAGNQVNQFANQVGTLNSQLSQFDSDNQNLHAQVAALQQRLQTTNNYNDQLRTQLADQMAQLQQTRIQLQQTNAAAQQQIAAARAEAANQAIPNRQITGQLASATSSSPKFNGATIRGTSDILQRISTVQLPGYRTWADGDVIRIEGPTDRLFVSGTYQLNQNDTNTLAGLANVIRQQFPRQVIGVEAHWDGSPIQPATTSHHQLTAIHSLAVFDLLVRAGLPNDQIFTMALGSNRPRYAAGNSNNRRIEIVIYPETF